MSGVPNPEPLSPEWVDALVMASAGREGLSGVVAIAIGKTRQASFEIDDGRVVAPAEPGGTEVTIPLTAGQLADILAGTESLAQAFMRGDVKPQGSTGALLAAVDLFEDDQFRRQLIEHRGASPTKEATPG